jgi:hypothetical protein
MFARFWKWVRGGDTGEKLREQKKLLETAANMIGSLNVAMGQAHAAHQAEHYEKLYFLGAMAMREGGEIFLPTTFMEAIHDGNYFVHIDEDKVKNGYCIRLEQQQPSSAEEDKTHAG